MTSSAGSTGSRRLIVLGSTGSIGTNVLHVVEHLRERGGPTFDIVGLATGGNATMLAEQAQQFGVRDLAIADESNADELANRSGVTVRRGPDAALELIESIAEPGDLVVGAMVGSAGVPATLAAVERGCDLALANKETLVAAGMLVMPLAHERGVHIIPIDSEHNALFQCMQCGRSSQEIARLVITASGGPFRTWPAARVASASVADALNHPTWDMGPKVTVDSASLMNKALEVIEAHWLFGLPETRIDAIVHPQSIIHGFVEFIDGSVVAQLGPPDMRTPIQYALTWPRRAPGSAPTLDWAELRQLDFEPVDHDRFPAIELSRKVIRAGGTAGAIFNAANEVAVEAFLGGRIAFGRIAEVVRATLEAMPASPVRALACVMDADAAARAAAEAQLGVDSGVRQSAAAR